MNVLKDHQILFDAECPMCILYTKAIVKAGILDTDGRAAYQEVSEQVCPMLDRQRAVNEIALVNRQTGEVTYGIHSLFKVMAAAFPRLRFLFSFKPFVWVMGKVYAFISYNRRVIIPPGTDDRFQLQPTFRLFYRIAYIVLSALAVGSILTALSTLLTGMLPQGIYYREYFICGGQVLFQGFVVFAVNKKKTWAYLGNMMTVSLAGSIALLPLIWLAAWLPIAEIICTGWFLVVVLWMLLEHIRRCKLLETGWVLTASWIFYRIAVLALILTGLI